MKRSILLYLTAWFLTYAGVLNAQNVSGENEENTYAAIIPRPLTVKVLAGQFLLDATTTISVIPDNAELRAIAEKLSAGIKKVTGISLRLAQEDIAEHTILLTTQNASDTLGQEGYSLSVRPEKVVINAPGSNGIFYGVQTLLQLLPVQADASEMISLSSVDIVDKPRFSWRGLMLDVGRYYYSVDFIKKFIDYMARHKLNTFHWHLTEDHGWRLEIKKYPELVNAGAVREGTQYDRSAHQVTMTPHWGYYTQQQISEVVAYAKERYVSVVPEIEMPGHTLAALVAYPELSCAGGPFKIPLHWGIQKDIYCAGKEKTFEFLEDVLSEVVELFPSPIIHIGGDEAPKDRWEACPKCQARIKEEGLKDEHELQSYFIKRVEDFLLSKNKRIIGWDEILEGGLAPNAAVMSWRGIKGGITAARLKHDVVMSPKDYMYFDYYQGEPYLEPRAYKGLLTLKKVYSYEPVPAELTKDEQAFIKGVQGNIWSEYIHSPEKVEYMTFPRAAALAEVAWSNPDRKNWMDFIRRMEFEYQRYDILGIHYSKSAYDVWHTTVIDSATMNATVTLKTQSHNPEIRYTLDGSKPDTTSLLYRKAFEINIPRTVKAATFKDGKQVSKVSVSSVAVVPFSNTKK